MTAGASSRLRRRVALPCCEVRDLDVSIHGEAASFLVVRNMAFAVAPGETLAIVGESGLRQVHDGAVAACGSSLPRRRSTRGSILLEGADLRKLPQTELEDLRGNRIGMIFQEPLTSLNPVMTIGDQIAEGVMQHRHVSRRTARRRAIETLDPGAHAGSRAEGGSVSAPALGRHAPAGDDRLGARLRAARCSSPTSRRPLST